MNHVKLIGSILFLFVSLSAFTQEIEVLEYANLVEIEELNILNTDRRECNLSLMPNGSTLYFMSTRSKSARDNEGDGDIYRSENLADGNWGAPEFLSQINTYYGEDEPSVSYDGEKIYFQSWKANWQSTGGPYYEANLVNGKLRNIRGLGGGINQFFRREFAAHMGYATDGMAVSADGNLFIVACGSDYQGNMDLFYSVKQFGSWSFPELLGVSTRGNERSIYISADNKTIYFSSDGHGGFGGLDIFKTTLDGWKTGAIVNIGKPFNTRKDDMGFVISGEGKAAFFVRDLDIYYADLSQLNEEIKPSSSTLIFGTVSMNNEPLQTTVVVKCKGKILGKTQSDESGKYALTLAQLTDETEVFIEDDSTELFENHSIKPKLDVRYVEYEVNFSAEQRPEPEITKKAIVEEIKEPEVNAEAVIYFDFDQHVIKASEENKLKELLSAVVEGSVVLVDGHTDHYGTNSYNEKLSEKRADVIMDWFIQNSTAQSPQIKKTFKGESKPLNTGSTSEERALNRRVTVRIENN